MAVITITIGDIDVDVQFKPIKNLHLSVHPPLGNVTVSSPDFYELEKVKIYLATKLGWIKREQKKFLNQAREGEKLYITKESHLFFGKRYLLKVIEANQSKIIRKGNVIELYAKKDATIEQKRNTLYNWYRKQLHLKITALLEKHTKRMQLEVPEYKIYKMKTKWGSCSTDSKRLLFNIELVKKPNDCIEYIVIHELVHLIERHHNKNFIILMDKYLPNWRIQKKILNDLPL